MLIVATISAFAAGCFVASMYNMLKNKNPYTMKRHIISTLSGISWYSDDVKLWLSDVMNSIDSIDEDTLVLLEYTTFSSDKELSYPYRKYSEKNSYKMKCKLGHLIQKFQCNKNVTNATLHYIEVKEPVAKQTKQAKEQETVSHELDRRVIEELRQLEKTGM